MKRREFLRKGLRLGAMVSFLSGTGLATSGWCGELSRLMATSSGPFELADETSKVRNFTRKFYCEKHSHMDNHGYMDDPPEGTPPIWAAAIRGDWKLLKHCLDEDPSLIATRGDFIACENGDFGPTYCWNHNVTLLHIVATWTDNLEALRYLVSLGAKVNARADQNRTPLHIAVVWASKIDVVKYLIFKGAKVNSRTTNKRSSSVSGFTPLHLADDVNVAKYLIFKGAKVDARDSEGCTPLHHAAERSDLDVVECLVSLGADVYAKNKEGETPFDLLKQPCQLLKY